MARFSPQERDAIRASLAVDEAEEERERRIDEALGPVPFERPVVEGALARRDIAGETDDAAFTQRIRDLYGGPSERVQGATPPEPRQSAIPAAHPAPRATPRATGGSFGSPGFQQLRATADQPLEDFTAPVRPEEQKGGPTVEERGARYGLTGGPGGEERPPGALARPGAAPAGARRQRAAAQAPEETVPAGYETELDPETREALGLEEEEPEGEEKPVGETLESALEEEAPGRLIEPEEPDPTEGLVKTAVSVERSPAKLQPLEEAEIEEAEDELFAAKEVEKEAAKFGVDAETFAQRAQAHRAEQIRQEFADAEERRQEAMRAHEADYAALQSEIESQNIEEPTMWSGNFGTDLMRGIGAMLIGLGAGPQAALQSIKEKVNQNLEFQKEKIAKGRKDLDARGSIYEKARLRFADERVADAAAKEAAYAKLADDMKNWLAFAKSPEAKARIEAAHAEFRKEQVMAGAARRAATEDVIKEQHQLMMPKATGGGRGLTQDQLLEKVVKREKLRKELKDLQGEGTEIYVPEAQGYATNKESAKKLRKVSAEKNEALGLIRQIVELSEENPIERSIPGSTPNRKLTTLHETLKGKLNHGILGGVLTDSHKELMESMLPSPTAVLEFNITPSYHQAQDILEESTQSVMEAEGVRFGAPPERMQPAGGPGFEPEGEAQE